MLGWIMNLDFAGGTTEAPPAPVGETGDPLILPGSLIPKDYSDRALRANLTLKKTPRRYPDP